MRRYTLDLDGHRLEIAASLWSGRESVTYDGREVSSKRSLFYVTVHSFSVEEGGRTVVYEVNVLTSWMGFDVGYAVRRNGIIAAHRP
jgi:hypothetical protein